MNKKRLWLALAGGAATVVVVAAALAALLWTWTDRAPEAVAFDKFWGFTSCTNVASGEKDLWDDAPGAGLNNETGFFWIVANSIADERCTADAGGEGVSTTAFPQLRVRVAVNDGAIFLVALKTGSEFCSGGSIIAALGTTTTEDTSRFITKTVALPAGMSVGEVCITLNDDPDSQAQRISALIDDIRIWNPTSGAIGWRERFTRAN